MTFRIRYRCNAVHNIIFIRCDTSVCFSKFQESAVLIVLVCCCPAKFIGLCQYISGTIISIIHTVSTIVGGMDQVVCSVPCRQYYGCVISLFIIHITIRIAEGICHLCAVALWIVFVSGLSFQGIHRLFQIVGGIIFHCCNVALCIAYRCHVSITIVSHGTGISIFIGRGYQISI